MGDGSVRDRSRQSITEKMSPYPVDTSDALEAMRKRYGRRSRAENVSFRRLVSWLKVGERATHYIHPYPAKLLPQIAHFFLAARELVPENATILDPFGGTGTVALEAILSGRNALYADVNPLARLIASVKTSPIATRDIDASMVRLLKAISRPIDPFVPDVVNINHWYNRQTIQALSIVRSAIEREPLESARMFMQVTFSAVARKVSYADPRLSVPVKKKAADAVPTDINSLLTVFQDQFNANRRRVAAFDSLMPIKERGWAKCVGHDARRLEDPSSASRCLTRGSVDLIITSPPYAGAQKYIRASSLSLGWLGLANRSDLAPLEQMSIGREHYSKKLLSDCPATGIKRADHVINLVRKVNPLRALIVASYLLEMRTALEEMYRVLRVGGHLVLVVGNNEVCGQVFKSSEYLAEIANEIGFDLRMKLVDDIKSRGLMTKRNRSAGIISREWVLLLEK